MTTPRDSSNNTGAYSIGAEQPKRRFPWWLLALLALLLLALLLLALSQCGTDAPTRAVPAATVSAAPTEEPATSPEPTPSPEPTTPEETTSPEPTSDGGGAGAAVLTAGGESLLPLADAAGAGGDLSQYTGQAAEARSVTVQSVPADEGFWVGTSESDRVWVQLTGKAGESDYQVQDGDTVVLDGEMVKTPPGFAKEVGVTGAEGAKQLQTQKAHIEAAKSSVKLSP